MTDEASPFLPPTGKDTLGMLGVDPTTTSGKAIASLFRTWCALRGDDPEGGVNGSDLVEAVAEHFEALGLDIDGPASQVDAPAGRDAATGD